MIADVLDFRFRMLYFGDSSRSANTVAADRIVYVIIIRTDIEMCSIDFFVVAVVRNQSIIWFKFHADAIFND